MTFAATIAFLLRYYMARANAKRDAEAAENGEDFADADQEQLRLLGDRHPTWRYQL